MNLKRILRGPILWIILAVVAIGLLVDFSGSLTGGYRDVPTSQVVSLINGNDPLTEVTMVDKEQQIQVTTKGDQPQKFKAIWVGTQSQEMINRLNERVAAGTLDRWVGSEPHARVLPLPVGHPDPVHHHRRAVLLPAQLGAGRRQPGDAVRQVQGQGGQQGHPQDDLRRRGGGQRGGRGAPGDQGVPGRAGQVPGRRGQDPQGRAAVRASRAPARPCSPGPSPARRGSRSSPSPARTSSRCSSVSAPRGSATCSSRPRRTRPPSSSSTRSTPSAGTAVPAWAAATTSASRPSTSCWSRWTASTSAAA